MLGIISNQFITFSYDKIYGIALVMGDKELYPQNHELP